MDNCDNCVSQSFSETVPSIQSTSVAPKKLAKSKPKREKTMAEEYWAWVRKRMKEKKQKEKQKEKQELKNKVMICTMSPHRTQTNSSDLFKAPKRKFAPRELKKAAHCMKLVRDEDQ